MQIDQLKAFLSTLSVYNLNWGGSKWAQCSCPLAPFTHKSGTDSNPSFGVTVGDEPSNFNCYVCAKGTLADLVGQLMLYCQKYPEQAYRYDLAKAQEILQHEHDKITVLPEYKEMVPSPYVEFQEWPEYWLEDYLPWEQHYRSKEYVLFERRVHYSVADIFGLRYDPAKDMVVSPFRTASGKLAGARGRAVDADCDKKWRHYDYPWNKVRNSGLVWFNERALNLPGPLVLVEGQFDCMRIWPFYKKVMAILSAKTTLYKQRKLTACDQVVLMLDDDKTGQDKTQEWIRYLSGHGVQVGVLSVPEGVKDAGECHDSVLKELFAGI